jgi:hypothetical protein
MPLWPISMTYDMSKMDDVEVFCEVLHQVAWAKHFIDLLHLGWGIFMGIYNQHEMAEL